MLLQIWNAWKNNRGNLLLLLGVLAGGLMCLVSYFELVPEVRLLSADFNNSSMAQSPRAGQHLLVATIHIPIRPDATEDDAPEVFIRGIVEVYVASRSEAEDYSYTPLVSHTAMLSSRGQPQAIVFSDLPPGRYAVVAYLDLNENEMFDSDEASDSIEPFRLAQLPDQHSDSVDLKAGIIELIADQTQLIEFDFRPKAK